MNVQRRHPWQERRDGRAWQPEQAAQPHMIRCKKQDNHKRESARGPLMGILLGAIAFIALCLPPLAAQAGSWGGTVLSKGLVYDDVYGVVGGNAIMTKKVDEQAGHDVMQMDLVGSDGTVKFSTGFIFDDEEYPQMLPHESYAYRPASGWGGGGPDSSSGFRSGDGSIVVQSNVDDSYSYVNPAGETFISGADGIATAPGISQVIEARLNDGALDLKLWDSATGRLLDQQKMGDAIISISFFNGFDPHYDGDWSVSWYAQTPNDEHARHSIEVIDDKMHIDYSNPDSRPPLPPYDPNNVYINNGYTIRLTEARDLSFTLPDGTSFIIRGPFLNASCSSDGVITTSKDNGDAYETRFYTINGAELFAGRGFSRIVRIENGAEYLCSRSVDGWSTYEICRPDENAGTPLHTAEHSACEVVGSYITEVVGDYTGERRLTRIFDRTGSVRLAFDPSEQCSYFWKVYYNEEVYPAPLPEIYHVDKQHGKNAYYDKDLNLITEFDGDLGVAQEFDGEMLAHLLPDTASPYDNKPFLLFDKNIEPALLNGMQRVRAAGAAERGELNYVTDGKGRYGALDDRGREVIPVEFENICDLGENLDDSTILVKRDGKWYFMDVTGRVPQPQEPSFSDVVAGETPHAEHIAWLAASGVSKGWGNGDGSYSFRPYTEVARCDMAAFLYRLAGSPVFEPSAEQRAAFSDVDEGTPHAREVWWLAAQGISAGWTECDGAKTFRPYETVKRCDMAAFLNRLANNAGKPAGAGSPFADVADATPHRAAVLWLASNEVSKGWAEPDGTMTFRPYETVKRADMAAFLHRMDEKGLVGEA